MIDTSHLFVGDEFQFDLVGSFLARVRAWLGESSWRRRGAGYAARHRAAGHGQSTMVVRAREIAELAAAFPEMAPIPGLVVAAPLAPPMHPSYSDEPVGDGRTVFPPPIRSAHVRNVDGEVAAPESLPRRLAPDWRARTGEIPVATIGVPGELAGAR